MQGKGIQRSATEGEDEQVQRAVLALVLNEHPAQLTGEEIAREVGKDAEQATDDLVSVGLLRREGASVLPTRAALHFEGLAA